MRLAGAWEVVDRADDAAACLFQDDQHVVISHNHSLQGRWIAADEVPA